MRGLDTNVLVRYIAWDDPVQSPLVDSFLHEAEKRSESHYVSTIALCELCWTLRGRPYSLDRAGLAGVVDRILSTRLFVVQDRDLIHRALDDFREGPGDFPDYLIGRYNRQAGCADTVTFDRDLRGEEGFSFLR